MVTDGTAVVSQTCWYFSLQSMRIFFSNLYHLNLKLFFLKFYSSNNLHLVIII